MRTRKTLYSLCRRKDYVPFGRPTFSLICNTERNWPKVSRLYQVFIVSTVYVLKLNSRYQVLLISADPVPHTHTTYYGAAHLDQWSETSSSVTYCRNLNSVSRLFAPFLCDIFKFQ